MEQAAPGIGHYVIGNKKIELAFVAPKQLMSVF